MLPLLTDRSVRDLSRIGLGATLPWAADDENDAVLLVEASAENIRRVERWFERMRQTVCQT